MMTKDDKTRAIFAFICASISQYGNSPTMREIADEFGYTSNSGVIRHLDKLEKWGWIERYHGRARSIHILRPCRSSNVDSRGLLPPPPHKKQ